MNLEMIQARMQDIEQMRQASRRNESRLMDRKERTGTLPVTAGESDSSLPLRFLLAGIVSAILMCADYYGVPHAEELLKNVNQAISYNINAEDVENLKEIWYTISDTLLLDDGKGST